MQSTINQEISFNKTFEQAGLPSFLELVLSHNNYKMPTPIQYYSIKTGIQNKESSLICRSKSGTGKTIAYTSLAMLNFANLQKIENKTYCIVLVPTRQLAVQVYQTIKSLIDSIPSIKCISQQQKSLKQKLNDLNIMLSIGGISFQDDRKKYRQSQAQILVCTIGRLWQLFKNHILILAKNVFTIFDQGDKMLGKINSDDKLRKVIGLLPTNAKWYIYSATYTKKMIQDINKIKKCIYLHTLLKNNQLDIVITSDIQKQLKLGQNQHQENLNNYKQLQNKDSQDLNLQNIKKFQININHQNKSLFDQKIIVLQNLLSTLKFQKCLIFVQKKSFLQQISQSLSSHPHILIHGSLSQASRFRMMNCVNNSKIIIASDLLSRGIDIRLDLVILFDARQGDTFWHRIGRTGRYGRTGVVISMDSIQNSEWKQFDLAEVNGILQDIELFDKKEWYGGHMTQIGKWKEVDQKLQAQNNYKYFNQSKIENNLKQISQIQQQMGRTLQNQEKRSKQKLVTSQNNSNNIKQILSSINSKNQLKKFIKQKILKCKSCLELINNTTKLTGYQFQLLKYINQTEKV